MFLFVLLFVDVPSPPGLAVNASPMTNETRATGEEKDEPITKHIKRLTLHYYARVEYHLTQRSLPSRRTFSISFLASTLLSLTSLGNSLGSMIILASSPSQSPIFSKGFGTPFSNLARITLNMCVT